MEHKLVVIGFEHELLFRKKHRRNYFKLIEKYQPNDEHRILRLIEVTTHGKPPSGFNQSHVEYYLEYVFSVNGKIEYQQLTQIHHEFYGGDVELMKDENGITYLKKDGLYFTCYRQEHNRFTDLIKPIVDIDDIKHHMVSQRYFRKYTYEIGII